ncbi:uncharacterized protein LOC133193359 [Saccostrea echinata]|uniref:uncharacterized protein LOC133193359 n=1 Tax=Saccostrea echinata TaxID=191078 RepID=UPI002A7FD5CB|nr:uncharacterized protein LOC133193359 [Saccostrea echinata]
MTCSYTYHFTFGSGNNVSPVTQPQTQIEKRLSDAFEKRIKSVESDRYQRSKSEGYRSPYSEKWYSVNNFPRLSYHHQLVSRLATKMRDLRSSSQVNETIGVKRVQLYLAGEITKDTEKLITSSKEEHVRCSLKGEKRWPVSALIYFQSENEPLDRIEELLDSIRPIVWTKAYIVLNQAARPSEDTFQSKYSMLTRKKKCVREALTSFLETPLKKCIEGFLEELNVGEGSREEIPKILNECKSLLLQMSSKRNEMQIPETIKNLLFERYDVHGFGIWDTSEFRVFVRNKADIESLKYELFKLEPEFLNTLSLHIVSGEVKIYSHVKQGEKVYLDRNGENSKPSYATAGALLKDNLGQDEVYGLTCHHALPREKEFVYVTSLETTQLAQVGECIYSDPEPFHDFAVFQVDEDKRRNCDTTFLNRMEDPCNVNIHQGIIPSNAVVHKKGATTNFTDGRILSSEFYYKLFGNRNEMFLVSSLNSSDYPFSLKGDSGSVVFQHDRSPDQKSVFALGLVTGGIDEVRDESLKDVLNSTVCLRLNKALSRLSEKKQLNLEFENSCRISSSSDESV